MEERRILKSCTIRTLFDEATAHEATLAPDMAWQPNVIEFWTRLFNQAPTPSLARGYGSKLQHAKLLSRAQRRLYHSQPR